MSRRRVVVVLAVVVAVLVALDLRTFVGPPSDRPVPTDGVVVLGPGYLGSQLATGLAIRALRPGTPVLLSAPANYCPGDLPTGVTCFDPDPFTTQGEARYAATYARAHGWRDLTVVAPPAQLSRARLRVQRCWSGQLTMVASQSSIGDRLSRTAYETAAMGKALVVQRGC